MKKKSTTKIVQVVQTKPKRTKSKKKRKSRKSGSSTSGMLRQYANLISNPCHGPLLRSVGLGQITERVRATAAANVAGTDTAGYVVWFPSYHNPGVTAEYSSNLFYFDNASTSVQPLNTTANPTGMVALATTGLFRADPASAILGSSAAFSRAKTMSACLQVEYLGALQSISGQVAIIPNLPFRAFYGTSATTVINPPTVDTLFAYASVRQRLQVTGHEVIWRPSDDSSVFRTAGNEGSAATAVMRADAVLRNGNPASTSTTIASTEPDEIYGICIAWRGVPAVASCLSINAVKVVDLELAPSGFAVEPTFAGLGNPAASSINPVNTVTSWLDRYVPNWQFRAVNASINAAGQLAMNYAPAWAVSTITPGIRGRSYPSIQDRPMPPPPQPYRGGPMPGGW